jgi:hypothetical protein
MELPTSNFAASSLLVLFIPSHDRNGNVIDHEFWVDEALNWCGRNFGGATAFPQGRGVWRDDSLGGKLHFDNPTIVQCYTTLALIETNATELTKFLRRLGQEANQAAVGWVINDIYYEYRF